MNRYPEASPYCEGCGELRQACTCETPKKVEAVRFVRMTHIASPNGPVQWAALGSEFYGILVGRGWVETPWEGSDEH